MQMIEEHLDEALTPFGRLRAELIFMQDGASYHKAKGVSNWFQRKHKNSYHGLGRISTYLQWRIFGLSEKMN